MGPERHPAGRLGAVTAEQHPRYRGLQVVVADLVHRRTSQHLERLLVTFEERLLPLGGVRPVHRLARAREPQREQEALGAGPGQVYPQISEVDLRFGTRFMGLQHVRLLSGFASRRPVLRATFGDVVANRRIGQLGHVVFVDQPGQDPAGGVALLAWCGQIHSQHRVDQRLGRVQLRRRPDRGLPCRWDRVPQRLPHRPPMHLMPVGQRPDRKTITPMITPDRLEQLHPRPRHFRPSPSPTRTRRAFGVGPDQTVITMPGVSEMGPSQTVTVGPDQTDRATRKTRRDRDLAATG